MLTVHWPCVSLMRRVHIPLERASEFIDGDCLLPEWKLLFSERGYGSVGVDVVHSRSMVNGVITYQHYRCALIFIDVQFALEFKLSFL